MKKMLLCIGVLFILGGCDYVEVFPVRPNGATLLAGFNGRDTLSVVDKSDTEYSFPRVDLTSFDTVEISFNYSHQGNYAQWFALSQIGVLSYNQPYVNTLWQDSLTQGTKFVMVKMTSDEFQPKGNGTILSTTEYSDVAAAPSDTTYLFNLKITGWRKK